MTTPVSPTAPGNSAFGRFIGKFSVLKNALPELWLSFAIKVIAIAAYALTNSTLVIWMHSELGYNDKQALQIVAAWSLLMSAMTLLVGSLTDVLGIRRTLFIGTFFCVVGRAVMVWSTTRWVVLSLGLAPLALGEALGGPVLVAAARCYSNTRQRSMSFSMIYAMMNLGFWLSAWLFDRFRKGMGEHGQLNVLGSHISTYQTLFLISLILEVSLVPLIFFLRDRVEATDEGFKELPQKTKPSGQTYLQSVFRTSGQIFRETVQLFATLFRQSGFHRLLAFLILISFVKLIYRQMDYVYPTFGIRELGDGAPFMTLWGWNSLLIIILAPLVGSLTQKFAAYPMVIIGGMISSASIFIMALPPAMFVSLADGFLGNFIGHRLGLQGPVHPYYVMIALFVLVLSVGEAFYSPRVYEYAAAIAPKGQEASYSALSYVPLLLPKMLIGLFSGQWLMRYCPETGPRHSETLWLIVALFSLVAPIGLIGLRRFIQVKEAGRDEAVAL